MGSQECELFILIRPIRNYEAVTNLRIYKYNSASFGLVLIRYFLIVFFTAFR